MASDPFIAALLSGRGRRAAVPPAGGGGDTIFAQVANALIESPRIVDEEERQARLAEIDEQSKGLGLERSQAELERLAQQMALEDERNTREGQRHEDAREAARLAGISSKMDIGREAALLDPESVESQRVEEERKLDLELTRSQIERNRRPPASGGAGSRFAPRVLGVDDRGRTVVTDPSGTPVVQGEPYTGPIYRADVNREPLQQLSTFGQIRAALQTVDERFSDLESSSFINVVRTGSNLERLRSAVMALSTPLGRAIGEDRITDKDREVYSALISPGTTQIVLQQLGLPVESVRESLRRLLDTIGDMENAIVQDSFSSRGARLDLSAGETLGGNVPGFQPGQVFGQSRGSASEDLSPEEDAILRRLLGGS